MSLSLKMGGEVRFLIEILLTDMTGINQPQVNRIHVDLQTFLTAVGFPTLPTGPPSLNDRIFLLGLRRIFLVALLRLYFQSLQLAILNFPLMSFKITSTLEAFQTPTARMMIFSAEVWTSPEHQGVNICQFLGREKRYKINVTYKHLKRMYA